MAIRCHACGCESELEIGFEKRRSSFRRRVEPLCPSCGQRRRQRELKSLLRFTAGSALLGAALLFVVPELPVAWLALNLLLLDLVIHLGTAIHEACHALSGRALGLKVFRIVLGCGRTQWKGPLFGILVEWKAIPLGGMTLVAPVSPGAVLVALGESELGIALLRSSLEKVFDPRDRARVECAVAIGLAQQGDLEAAKAALERARAADPRCQLLERASRSLRGG